MSELPRARAGVPASRAPGGGVEGETRMNNTKRPALGRGLGALIPGAQHQSSPPTPIRRDYFECAIEDVHPTADNPRQRFDEQKLNELAESIRNQGLVQPLVVRQRSA